MNKLNNLATFILKEMNSIKACPKLLEQILSSNKKINPSDWTTKPYIILQLGSHYVEVDETVNYQSGRKTSNAFNKMHIQIKIQQKIAKQKKNARSSLTSILLIPLFRYPPHPFP